MQMYDALLSVVDSVQAKLNGSIGEENCRGLTRVIRMGWLDHLESEPGKASQLEWDEHKMQHGGSLRTTAFEARRPAWRSAQVSTTLQ